ncbi:MAG: pyridoxamine 5'-phosphate oxidase family protein [Geminicoccaceae bacterium]
MGHRFADIAFTDRVKALQKVQGSRTAYSRLEGGEVHHNRLGVAEAAFLAERDSFYMATVSETGWPYVQHRGGPPGFIKVLDERTLGFADFRGNQQFVSVGNLVGDDRVALILVDYPRRRRLKILGHARVVTVHDDPDLVRRFELDTYPAKIERALVITVDAFDWNCPQHITPRFTEAEIAAAVAPLRARIAELEAELARR